MVDNNSNNMANNYRSAVIVEPNLMPPGGGGNFGIGAAGSSATDTVLQTPFAGNVRALPPPLPQSPYANTPNIGGYGGYGGYNSGYGGGFGSYGGYGGFGGGYGGLGGFSSYGGGYGGYGGFGGGAYNRFGGGMNAMDPEARFIQLAEASSRPAFQSIESLVSAIGNIAAMLDSTFFALTSSFRAILGVAANFGRLRGVFAQFWQTFAIFRGLKWIYKKILYWLRISNLDPSSENFKQAFAEAVNETSTQSGAPPLPRKGQSPWPVLAFISFIFTAPYLIMKLLGTVTNTAQEEARNPAKWVQPIETVVLYDFQARNPSELNIRVGQHILVAPKEIQNTLGLLNTGWALASTSDRQTSGIIPINYVKSPQQLRAEQQQQLAVSEELLTKVPMGHSNAVPVENAARVQQPELANLSAAAFPAPPVHKQQQQHQEEASGAVPDFDIAPQPLGKPVSTEDATV